ncbi:MAG: threonine synthase [Alphaproteobacteria bacterium]
MRYVSTRGQAPVLDFSEVLLAGLARDGGLYLPESWPRLNASQISHWRGLSYGALAKAVMTPFVGTAIAPATLERIVDEAVAEFGHPAVAPLVQLDANLWLMELFHGPTLAFKDYALQLVGRLFDHVLAERGRRITIVTATSGDTGSAAIEACRDRAAIDIFVLHPKGRVSEVQRRQMTTVDAPNVHNIAIDGTFDDCQDLVKALFADLAFADEVGLSAVNSINWARIMAQIVYYVWAGLALGAPDRPVAFAVPTGNFGNVYAGHVAAHMGLPVNRLIIGSNRNDILARFLTSQGRMETRPVEPSLSPSMDIQVSSNFERLLFETLDRDGTAVDVTMKQFRTDGRLDVSADRFEAIRREFSGARVSDEETLATIRRVHDKSGILLDPHTAVGLAAGLACRPAADIPVVCLATAHPAKFPDAVEKATGVRPSLPPRLADLFERAETCDSLANDVDRLRRYIRSTLGCSRAA